MKRFIKRAVSLTAALSIALSGMPALAAQTITLGGYWRQSFDGLAEYSVPDDMYIKLDAVQADNDALAALAQNGGFIGGKSAQMGKADGFFAAENPGAAVVLGAVDSADATSLKKASGLAAQVSGSPKAHIGFEMAVADTLSERKLTFEARNKAGTAVQTLALINIAEGGAVKAGITATDYVMPTDKWVHFDLYFTVNKDSASTPAIVYADGGMICEAATLKYAPSSKKSYGAMSVESVKLSLAAGENGCYVDNLTVEKVAEYPELSEPVLSHTDADINGRIDNKNKSIELVSSMTAQQFKNGLNRDDVELVDMRGEVQNGGVCDGFAIVGGEVYYKLSVYEQTDSLNINFEGVSINSAEELATLGLTLSGDAAVETAKGIGARGSDNTALKITDTGAIIWKAAEKLTDDKIIAESALMSADGAKITFSALCGDTEIPIYTVGDKEYFWYKATAVIDKTTKSAEIFINGRPQGVVELSTDFDGIDGVKFSADNGGIAAVDDITVRTGEYVTGIDRVEITANSSAYVVDDEEKVLYIPADTDTDGIAAGFTVSDNAAFDNVYSDAAMTEATSGSVCSGDYIVFASKTRSVYEAYRVKVTDEAFGINAVSSARMSYDNTAQTIFAPAYMSVKSFIAAISLADGHTAYVTDADGNTADASAKIYRGTLDGYKYVISYDNGTNVFTKEYEINTQYVNEGFDELFGKNIPAGSRYNALLYNKSGVSGGEATVSGVYAPDDGTECVAKLYSKPNSVSGTPQFTMRIDNIETAKTKSPYAITWDVYADNTNSSEQMIVKYTNKSGAAGNYYTLFELASGGVVKFGGQSVSTYNANEWTRIIMLLDPSGTGSSAVYINGRRVFFNSVGRFQKTIDSIQEFIFTHGVTSAERTTYYDNICFYPISSVADFDASPLDCVPVTQYDILTGNTVSGYGPATVGQFKELFEYPDGAAYKLISADGSKTEDEQTAAEGMKLVVTSANGKFRSEYTLAEPIRISAPQLLIDGRSMGYLIQGEASATAEVYSAYPLPMTLALTYTDGSASYTAVSERPADHRGKFVFDTGIAASVQNIKGEKLTLSLTAPDGSVEYAESKEIAWTGQLDLSSEITKAKNGATSIVTVTLDDGLVNTLNKCNTWFAQYGIRGTSVVWSDRAAEKPDTYAAIYDKGYIDVTSHSKTHLNLGTASGLTDATRLAELQGSKTALEKMFPEQQVITFAPSNGVMDLVSESMVDDYFWASRSVKRGYNSLDPADNTSVGGWYNLKIQGAHNPLDMSGNACNINDCLNEAVEHPVWLIYMYHSIETKEGQGTLPVLDGVAQSNFKRIGELQNSGDIWAATFSEATKYIRERQHCTIEDVATESSRIVTVTPDGTLPADIFNYPLTVKSQVPEDWAKDGVYIKASQGGRVQAPAVKNVDGGLYIYYDVLPTGVPVLLETVSEPPEVTIDSIKISYEGALTQETGATSAVVCTAATVPAENTDLSGIEWYVNDELQSSGALVFSYRNEKKGVYNIQARDALSGLASNVVTLTVKEAGLLFEDDFDQYSGTTLPSANWYANVSIALDEYPQGSGDISAAIKKDAASGYPGMHKTVSVSEGTPVIFSGSVAMLGAKQQFFLELRNTVTVTSENRMTALTLNKNGEIKAIDGTLIGKIPQGKWVHYALAITPAAAGEPSSVRVVLSGEALTDANGGAKGEPIVYETQYDLDKLAMAANGSVNMVHNNNFSSADENCVTYLNDVRIYRPQQLEIDAAKAEFLDGETVVMLFNNEVYGFDSSMISVKTASGEEILPGSIRFDETGRRKIYIDFAQQLEKGAEYTVTVDGSDALTNVMGEKLGFAQGSFAASELNTIEGISVTAKGELLQEKDSISTVEFTAAVTPAEKVDPTTVEWYVNGVMTGVRGLSFSFKPQDTGVYEIEARAGAVSSQKHTVTITAASAKEIVLSVNGRLYQSVNDIGSVEFTAGPKPADGLLELSQIEWYVNGEKTDTVGASFKYLPAAAGVYEISAVLAGNPQIKSQTVTVNVIDSVYDLQEYLLSDEFEAHGDIGTIFEEYACAPWSRSLKDSAKWVEIAAAPDRAGMAGKFAYTNSATAYPRLEKSGVELAPGKPFIMSANIFLNNPTAKLILELRAGSAKKEFAILANSKITVNGEAVDNTSYPCGEWLWVSACIIPGEDLSNSEIILAINSKSGRTECIRAALNLSAIGSGTGKTAVFNTALTAGKNDAVYIDDARLYYPQAAFLIAENNPTAGDDTMEISFNHDILASTLTRDSVTVTKNGEAVEVAEVSLDYLNPGRAAVRLAQPMEQGAEYELSLAQSVRDVADNAVFGTLKYGASRGGFKVTAVDTADDAIELTVLRSGLENTETISVYAAVYDGGVLDKVQKTDAEIMPGSGEQTVNIANVLAGSGDIRVFVWDGNMKPLW